MGPAAEDREYLVRVTRHPLDAVTREHMRHAGTLPDDYRSRSIEEHDFVNVAAANDRAAADQARRATTLAFKGEKATLHEVTADGSFRLIDTDL